MGGVGGWYAILGGQQQQQQRPNYTPSLPPAPPVKYADLKSHRQTNYRFNYDDMLAMNVRVFVCAFIHACVRAFMHASVGVATASTTPTCWP